MSPVRLSLGMTDGQGWRGVVIRAYNGAERSHLLVWQVSSGARVTLLRRTRSAVRPVIKTSFDCSEAVAAGVDPGNALHLPVCLSLIWIGFVETAGSLLDAKSSRDGQRLLTLGSLTLDVNGNPSTEHCCVSGQGRVSWQRRRTVWRMTP